MKQDLILYCIKFLIMNFTPVVRMSVKILRAYFGNGKRQKFGSTVSTVIHNNIKINLSNKLKKNREIFITKKKKKLGSISFFAKVT